MNRLEKALTYIESCPDKFQQKATTSKKFKEDLARYIVENYPGCSALELGTSYGQTTQLLSAVCDKVVTVDNVLARTLELDALGLQNVTALTLDLYKDIQQTCENLAEHKPYKLAFIDAVHRYNHCVSDAQKCLALGCDVLVFDDTGLFTGVNIAYQKVIKAASRLNVQYSIAAIGLPAGSTAHGEKVLSGSEGQIIDFTDISEHDRSKLVRSLSQDTYMCQLSIDIIEQNIQGLVQFQVDQMVEMIQSCGNEKIQNNFKEKSETIVENTRKEFSTLVKAEIRNLVGDDFHSLPEGSFYDVLDVIQTCANEYALVPKGELQQALESKEEEKDFDVVKV